MTPNSVLEHVGAIQIRGVIVNAYCLISFHESQSYINCDQCTSSTNTSTTNKEKFSVSSEFQPVNLLTSNNFKITTKIKKGKIFETELLITQGCLYYMNPLFWLEKSDITR